MKKLIALIITGAGDRQINAFGILCRVAAFGHHSNVAPDSLRQRAEAIPKKQLDLLRSGNPG